MNLPDYVSPVSESRPDTDRVVWVVAPGGAVGQLRFHSNLWWVPDGSMYVYFTPVFWWDEQ